VGPFENPKRHFKTCVATKPPVQPCGSFVAVLRCLAVQGASVNTPILQHPSGAAARELGSATAWPDAARWRKSGARSTRYAITIFGAEPRVNYNRIMLSPVLAGEKASTTS
jgi:hypothetical protein